MGIMGITGGESGRPQPRPTTANRESVCLSDIPRAGSVQMSHPKGDAVPAACVWNRGVGCPQSVVAQHKSNVWLMPSVQPPMIQPTCSVPIAVQCHFYPVQLLFTPSGDREKRERVVHVLATGNLTLETPPKQKKPLKFSQTRGIQGKKKFFFSQKLIFQGKRPAEI